MTIRVDHTYLRELETRSRRIAVELDGLEYAPEGFADAPPVADALEGFFNRWRRSRREIGDGLRRIEGALCDVRECFEDTDHDLSAQLDQAAR